MLFAHCPNSACPSSCLCLSIWICDGIEVPMNGFLLQCKFFHESLLDPKPQEYVWVQYMIHWLMGPACQWVNYLSTMEHWCLRNSIDFSNLVKWLFQNLRKEEPPEILFWGWGLTSGWQWGLCFRAPSSGQQGGLCSRAHSKAPSRGWQSSWQGGFHFRTLSRGRQGLLSGTCWVGRVMS